MQGRASRKRRDYDNDDEWDAESAQMEQEEQEEKQKARLALNEKMEICCKQLHRVLIRDTAALNAFMEVREAKETFAKLEEIVDAFAVIDEG